MPTWEEAVKARNLAQRLKAKQQEDATKEADSRKCGNCGKPVKAADSFCWNCAHPLEGDWIKTCKICKRLFKTVKPKERDTCNRCEGKMRREQDVPGLFRY